MGATVGLVSETKAEMVSFVAPWGHDDSEDRRFANCKVEHTSLRVPVSDMVTALLHRMAGDGNSCVVYIPLELRMS